MIKNIRFISSILVLATKYKLSENKKTFWQWCYDDLISKKEINPHQLCFLAADAISRHAVHDLEKLLFSFHAEMEELLPSAMLKDIVRLVGKKEEKGAE